MNAENKEKIVIELFEAISDPGNNIKAIKTVISTIPKTQPIKKVLQSYGKVPSTCVRQTPLQYAVNTGQSNAVKYLLDKYKLDINQAGYYDPEFYTSYRHLSHTPFGLATLQNKTTLAKLLVTKYGASIHTTPDDSPNALHIACNNNNYQLARNLIDRGAKIYRGFPEENVVERPGYMVAAEKGFGYIVKYFLEKEVPINDGDRFGHTALHLAAKQGDVSMANILLESDAELKPDKFGMTPLQIACIHKHEEMVKKLLNHFQSDGKVDEELKAETFELLGASLGIYSGYKYLCEAWSVRHNVEHIVKDKVVNEPQTCYDMQIEHESLKQLCEIYREEVECLTKHVVCNMYNERQEKESLIIKERILGKNNPFVAWSLERIKYHNLHSGKSQRFYRFLIKQLEIFKTLENPSSISSLWVEVSLYLARLPKMSSDVTLVARLEKVTRSCADVFMQENVWVNYSIDDWKKDLVPMATVFDTAVENIVTAFFYIFCLVPFEDDRWLEVKPILAKFALLSNKYLTQGKCTISALHALFNISVWSDFEQDITIEVAKKLIQMLVKCGINVNVRDSNGNTPLHYTALRETKWYTLPLIKIFKQQRAHTDIKNLERHTAHQVYLQTTYEEVIEEPQAVAKGKKRSTSRASTERSKSRLNNTSSDRKDSNKSRPPTNFERNKSRAVSRLSVVSDQLDEDMKTSRTVDGDLRTKERMRDKAITSALHPGVPSLMCTAAHVVKANNLKFKNKLNKKLRLQVLIH